MKLFLFLISMFWVFKANAQDYLIAFAGIGASNSVSTVKVENLTAGTSLSLSGSDILSLTITTGINSIDDNQTSELKMYPNPMIDNSTLQIYPPVTGIATISVYDMIGKMVTQIQSKLDKGLQELQISGLKSGSYVVSVIGSNYKFSGKLLSNSKSDGRIRIEKISNNQAFDEKIVKSDSKGVQSTVYMAYTVGDRLKYTGESGNYSTFKIDIPTGDETIMFNFIACTDGDNINYPVVEIGAQVWMAENLKTTKYNDGTAIYNRTDNTEWALLTTGAYSDYNNTPSNSITYGRLYNWYAIDNDTITKMASNGGKNVCPTGWHMPSDAEWTILNDYLSNNGYGYGGSGPYIAKSIAATSGWVTSPMAGNVGNDQASNNSSGFTGLPSGYRNNVGIFNLLGNTCYWWISATISTFYAYARGLENLSSGFGMDSHSKRDGLSVRCVKDN